MDNYLKRMDAACLTGHRPRSLPWGTKEYLQCCRDFKQRLRIIFTNIIDYGVHTFFTGMAEGFDMIATEILLDLKHRFNKNIKIIAAIPCKNQHIKWSSKQQARYHNILQQCDEKIVLSNEYTKTCMNDRNKYMVLNSEFCIACWNGNPSGTGNTVRFAKENGCRVKIIDINKYYY